MKKPVTVMLGMVSVVVCSVYISAYENYDQKNCDRMEICKGQETGDETTTSKAMHQKRQERCQKRLEKMAEKLNLTPDQKEKIKQMMESDWQKVEAEMKKVREIVKNMKEETNKQIESILNSDQQEKFRNMKKEMHKKCPRKSE